MAFSVIGHFREHGKMAELVRIMFEVFISFVLNAPLVVTSEVTVDQTEAARRSHLRRLLRKPIDILSYYQEHVGLSKEAR